MDYYNTPSQNNQNSHKKALSPTTAHSMQSIAGYRSSANLMSGVRLQINSIIEQAQAKKNSNNMALSAVYQANEQLLAELDPQRNLRLQNQQLRRQLNQALRQIMRLNKIIKKLQAQNNMLKGHSNCNNYSCGNQLLNDLNQLRSQGQSLRQKTIRLLSNK